MSRQPRQTDRDEAGWHARPEAEVLRTLDTGRHGLSWEEARSRLVQHGPNRLPVATGPSALALLVKQVTSPLIYALVASAAVAFAFGEVENGAVVLAVVVLNTLIGFAQEYRAGRAIAALSELVADPARVRRDGDWVELPAEELVPGDLVAVAEGERITADLRLLETQGLRTQEAALTGESTPVDKQPAPVATSTPLAERRNLLHAGTLVAAGTGHGVAVATGSSTELGRISALLERADISETPLTRELDRVGRAITAVIGIVAVLLGAAAAVRGFPFTDAALAAISLAVAAVPEGLPAVVTIALAIGVQRMARRRAIIRHLPAVETLGSTTVVASDKTGTLTQNQLSVESVWTPSGEPGELYLAALLCNDASPGEAGGGARRSHRGRAAGGGGAGRHRRGGRARGAPAPRLDPLCRRAQVHGDPARQRPTRQRALCEGGARGAPAALPRPGPGTGEPGGRPARRGGSARAPLRRPRRSAGRRARGCRRRSAVPGAAGTDRSTTARGA